MFAGTRLLASQADLAVVRIQVARQRPSWTVPWQMRPVESSSGTGAIIKSTNSRIIRILTAAHVVSDSTYLTVQRNTDWFDSDKITGKVIAEFHDTDLALVEVDDEQGAFSSIEPMHIAPGNILPELRSKVNVIGYPVGGDRLSVTEGVVSRVDMARYSHSGRIACSFTVDAAINAGNSGGPIVDPVTGNILGVAFQKLVGSGVESQGYGVPPYLIWRFLDMYKRSHKRPEIPSLGVSIQPLESPSLREYLGATHGVLVNWSKNPDIMTNDVILSVNGHSIDNQGLTNFNGRRIHFAAVIHDHEVGDYVELNILRDKQLVHVQAGLLTSAALDLVPSLQYSTRPEYIVVGGLVFQPLSLDYLQGWNERDRPTHLQELLVRGKKEGEKTQSVVLTNVLPARCNAGSGSGWTGGPVVKALNGIPVNNIQHLGKLVDAIMERDDESFFKFTVSGYIDEQLIVLKKIDIVRDEALLRTTYDIPRMRWFNS